MIKNYFNSENPCLIIAEIGVNHNGDINFAKKLIDKAKESGADAVKFQTFSAEKLVTHSTPKVKYQENTTKKNVSHFDMLKNLELSFDDHISLKEYCVKMNIDFLSTPYDIESANFLLDLGVNFFKTASADLVDLPLHKWIADSKKPCAISVGMSSIKEIENVIEIYKEAKNNNIILLHCVSNYPCSDKSLNMNVINTLKKNFSLPIGYSDHSIGNEAAVISIAMGARIIEKHFTIDKNLPGPDHQASANSDEFKSLVNAVRRAENMLGSSKKSIQVEERQMYNVSRKSIVLKYDMNMGDIIKLSDLELKRPGTGLMSKDIKFLIGKKLKKDLKKNHLISYEDLDE